MEKQINGERTVFAAYAIGTIGHPQVKIINFGLNLIPQEDQLKIDNKSKCETNNYKTFRRKLRRKFS